VETGSSNGSAATVRSPSSLRGSGTICSMPAVARMFRLLPLLLTLLACSCPAGSEDKTAAPAGKPSYVATLAFEGAAPGGDLAKLSYAVGEPDGVQPLTLTDVEKPPTATLTSYYATVKVSPWVLKPKVTNKVRQECWVRGAWSLCVRDSAGEHVGDFEVIENGALVLMDGSVSENIEVESVNSGERSLYYVYRKAPGGTRGEPTFAIEYTRDPAYAVHAMKAGDGWSYEFENPSGTLVLHDATTLLGLRDTLLASAESATAEQRAKLEEWASRPPDPCTGGG
jgi:hypothetical protein